MTTPRNRTDTRLPPIRLGSWLLLPALLGAISLIASGVDAAPRREFRIGLSSPFVQLEPDAAQTEQEQEIASLVYEPLVSIDPATLAPDVARSIAISARASEHGRTWTYALRPQVRFSDGSPLTAADVVRSLRRALLPVSPSSITATEASTVVVHLREASQAFALLATPISSARSLGSGPYRIAGRSASTVILARNPRFGLPASGPDVVTFSFRPDRAGQLESLLAGRLDALEIAPRESARLAPSPAITLVERPSLATLRLDLEGAGVPASLRSALATGIDREAIVAHAFDGHGLVASSVIPVGYLAWHRAPRLQAAFDPREARALLEHDGWQVGADGIRSRGKVRAEVRVAVDPSARLAAGIVRSGARAIGIDVVFDADAIARLALLSGGPSPDSLLAPLATGSSMIAGLLARAQGESSTALRARVYAQLQESASIESRAIPLAEPTTITAVSRARWALPTSGGGILSVGSSSGIAGLQAVRGRPVSWSGWILASALALGALALATTPWLRSRSEPVERAAS